MNPSLPTVKRTGFYPAAASDHLAPLQLLKGWVDHMIFCDLHKTPRHHVDIQELRQKIELLGLPEASFLLGDALSALECIKPVDVFFLRRDSSGEGGSGLNLLHADRIRLVLHVIKPGGLLIVDKANGYLWLTRMLSEKSPQYPVDDRTLFLSPTQPWSENRLYSVTVA